MHYWLCTLILGVTLNRSVSAASLLHCQIIADSQTQETQIGFINNCLLSFKGCKTEDRVGTESSSHLET